MDKVIYAIIGSIILGNPETAPILFSLMTLTLPAFIMLILF
jgi:hypothetical protein